MCARTQAQTKTHACKHTHTHEQATSLLEFSTLDGTYSTAHFLHFTYRLFFRDGGWKGTWGGGGGGFVSINLVSASVGYKLVHRGGGGGRDTPQVVVITTQYHILRGRIHFRRGCVVRGRIYFRRGCVVSRQEK
jgi:hypothetical protein